MKKTIYAALLFSTTALYPMEAVAMPQVIPFIAGIGGGLAGTAPLILGGLGGASAFTVGSSIGFAVAGFAGTALGGLLINSAISLGVSALLNSLRPKAQTPDPGQRMVNLRQPISDMEIVYGTVRKGGPVYFWETISGARVYGVLFAAHVISSFAGLYADNREITLDGDGYAQESQYAGDILKLDTYDGSSNVAPPDLLNNFTEWTSSHDMAGLAHTSVVATNPGTDAFEDAYPTGQPSTITSLINGKLCYDPRTETTVFTKNAALIIANWITADYGLNRSVNWDDVETEANAADVEIQDRDGNTLKTWELSGTFPLSLDRETVRAELGTACDCFFYEESDGTVGFKLGRYIAPTVTITDEEIIRAAYTEGQEGTKPINAFSVQYTEPSNGYVQAGSAAIENVGSGEAYEKQEIANYWVNHHNQACRLSKRYLAVEQAQYRCSFELTWVARSLRGQRFFNLVHSETGITQVMEIDKLVRNEGGITYTVECHSISSTDFDFDASTEEPEKPKYTNLTTSSDVPDPTGVSATSSGGSVLVSFDTYPRSSLLAQLRYRDTSVTPETWFEISLPSNQNYQTISGLADGTNIYVQVRYSTATGRSGNWVPNDDADPDPQPTLSVTVVSDTAAPNSAISVSATGGVGLVDLAWSDDNSANYAGARIYRNTADDFSSATLIHTEYGSPNAADSYQDSGLSADDYYYWIVSINGSGVAATETATGLVAVS
jgi:hypothetical protein